MKIRSCKAGFFEIIQKLQCGANNTEIGTSLRGASIGLCPPSSRRVEEEKDNEDAVEAAENDKRVTQVSYFTAETRGDIMEW